jgi:L-asparaginase
MQKLSGRCNGDFLILHGGAGVVDPKGPKLIAATQKLVEICQNLSQKYAKKADVTDADLCAELATLALQQLEDDSLFNAGLGACLQEDGVVRLSAGLMNGSKQRFSGVINCEDIRHPSLMAQHLQHKENRVFSAPGITAMAKELGLPTVNNVTQNRHKEWQKALEEKKISGHDTVGVVIKIKNSLFAGTSTGGLLNCPAGRVSDSATVAGNYASKYAAISATGVGEEIIDDALAARIECRVRDGLSLNESCEKSFLEALQLKRQYGWISVSSAGEWGVYYLTNGMSFSVFDLQNNTALQSSSAQ